ncbi:C2H2 zinc finger protein [Klebsormidium nitens]|uniref:Zinc finger protein 830 n=1 Tax=Klebsormidium nitens TaxID=105231 RepID=A0A1Y1I392_KLENI|nr:C2H2 zinc finger protein [Klebsormidium nitens]|eukprot:GAQ83206.1 C2H2 zinc finger protein [Klebsormidium nitens]
MKGTAAERKQRLDHPLVRYNDLGQIVCKLCNTVVKSEVAWNTHLVSRQHKETVARLKSKAASKQAQTAPAATPQPGSARKASDLPSDFFDTPKSKLSKGGASEKPAPPAKASNSTRRPAEPSTTPNAVPPGFFDGDGGKAGPSASNGAEPGARRIDSTQTRTVDQQKKDPGQKGVLPKGFFDDKEKDHKARGEEAPKLDINEEWKEFQKSVQVNIAEVDVRQEEEEAEAADEREEREVIEQRSFLQHIQDLKRQKEAKAREKAAAAAAVQQANGKLEEEELSSGSDDEDEDFALHWRAKKV